MEEEGFPEGKLSLDSKSSVFENDELERTEPEDVQSVLHAIDKHIQACSRVFHPKKSSNSGKSCL